MYKQSSFVLFVLLCCVWSPSLVHATPAEIVILLDTSRSMQEPVPGQKGTRKIDLAKQWVSQIADAAGRAGHRVGLFRFRQRDVLVRTGNGKRVMVTEDEQQCQLMGDMLVGVDAGSRTKIREWVDGKHGVGQPEVSALGHSPLLGSVRLILRYIRGRRMIDPQNNCVNAWIVILTDGEDTCTSGGSRHQALQEIEQVSHKEDVRTLVVSFHQTDVAKTLAGMGREVASTGRVFGAKDGPSVLKAISQIEGRIAPQACLLSGVASHEMGLDTSSKGGMKGGCKGCQSVEGGFAEGPLGILFLFGLLGFLFRRRPPKIGKYRALSMWMCVLFVLTGCQKSSHDAPRVEPLTDPVKRAQSAVKKQALLLRAGEQARKRYLAPLQVPAQVFAALKADRKTAGEVCQRFVHSMGYEPYEWIQRGVKGCLATRRCNAMDRALVLQACLKHYALNARLQLCRAHEVDKQSKQRLMVLASNQTFEKTGVVPSAFFDALERTFHSILQPSKAQSKQLFDSTTQMMRVSGVGLMQSTQKAARRLAKLAQVNARKSLSYVRRGQKLGLRTHAVVKTSTKVYDPVFTKPLQCTGGDVNIDEYAYKARAELLVQYVRDGKWQHKKIPIGRVEWKLMEHAMEPLHIILTDANKVKDAKETTLPGSSRSGCIRGVFLLGKKRIYTKSFPITSGATCEGESLRPGEGVSLARVTLRTMLGRTRRWVRPIERILLDRYGYAKRLSGPLRSGPMYSEKMTRRLLPMKIELLVGSGIPTQSFLMDRLMHTMWKGRDALRAALVHQFGVGGPGNVTAPLSWQTLAFYARMKRHLFSAKRWSTFQPVPWRIATLHRRGFVAQKKGLVIDSQTLFDIIDWSEWVLPVKEGEQDADERVLANISLGVLLTEAERLAAFTHSRTGRVINTAAMFRDSKTGNWQRFRKLPYTLLRTLPQAIREAAKARRRLGESLISSPGPVRFLGSKQFAWWRIEQQSGMAIGEIRYDGTFYGGIAAMKAISTMNECLASQAILALRGVRLYPDVKCCMRLAAKMWVTEKSMALLGGWLDILAAEPIKNMGKEAIKNAMARYRKQIFAIEAAKATKFMAGVRIGDRLFRAAYKFNDLYGKAEGAKKLYNMIYGDGTEAPPCTRLIPTKHNQP